MTMSTIREPERVTVTVSQGVPGPPGPVGPAGGTGPIGPAGPGVAAGGTAGQVLAKIDATNYNTNWVNQTAGLTLPFTQHLTFSPDNTYDIGASGASRPRNLYVAGNTFTEGIAYFGSTNSWITHSAANDLVLTPYSGVVEQRYTGGTNAQTFRIYNTYTDASNYERLSVGYSTGASAFLIQNETAGTGISRPLMLNSSSYVLLLTGGVGRWQVNSSGHLLSWAVDNAYDIGASGANRPRNVYVANNVIAQGSILVDTIGGYTGSPLSFAIPVTFGAAVSGTGNIIEQRNGTNPQTLRIYNTYTDASNYERLSIGWAANEIDILSQAAGTGVARGMFIAAGANLYVGGGGSARWNFQQSGHLYALADNAYDIGASGANRPRNVYVGSAYYTAMNTAAQGPGIWGGSGAPATGLGAVGDVYHRSDTPSTSLQRMYVKTAAATWTGIV